mgnify:CR=1 FL=1
MNKLIICLSLMGLSLNASAATYVALGDSITSGTNAAPGVFGNDYSWAVGSKLERTFARALGNRIDKIHALAIPGATAPVLLAQSLIAEQLHPSFVTIEIGGNDFAWGLGHQVVPYVRQVVERLSAADPKPRIFLATIPDLEQIYQLGQGKLRCQITHWIAPLFLKASLEKRQAISQAIRDANNEIIALGEDFANVTIVTVVGEGQLTPDDVSEVDCIHPSVKGQQRIADAFIRALEH